MIEPGRAVHRRAAASRAARTSGSICTAGRDAERGGRGAAARAASACSRRCPARRTRSRTSTSRRRSRSRSATSTPGSRRRAIAACDGALGVPMFGFTESFNLSRHRRARDEPDRGAAARGDRRARRSRRRPPPRAARALVRAQDPWRGRDPRARARLSRVDGTCAPETRRTRRCGNRGRNRGTIQALRSVRGIRLAAPRRHAPGATMRMWTPGAHRPRHPRRRSPSRPQGGEGAAASPRRQPRARVADRSSSGRAIVGLGRRVAARRRRSRSCSGCTAAIRTCRDYREARRLPARSRSRRSSTRTIAGSARSVHASAARSSPYDKIPPIVVDAFVAAEDNKFWTHGGVDYWGMFRAFFTNLRAGKTKQGASTITQQVVKTFLLTPERTFKRKIQEIILARRLEKALTKQEIMTLYMNQIYFGNGRYGVQEAARFYFGKDVDAAQRRRGRGARRAAAAPEKLAPNRPKNPKAREGAPDLRAEPARRRCGKLHAGRGAEVDRRADPGRQGPVPRSRQRAGVGRSRQAGADRRSEAAEDEAALDTLGAHGAHDARSGAAGRTRRRRCRAGLRARRQAPQGRARRSAASSPTRSTPSSRSSRRSCRRRAEGARRSTTRWSPRCTTTTTSSWSTSATGRRRSCSAATRTRGSTRPTTTARPRSRASGSRSATSSRSAAAPRSRRRRRRREAEAIAKHAEHRVAFAPGPEGAVVIIDVKTRKVRALVGGYASKVGGFNRATMAHRQPGSSFKPFVYAAAIDGGKYTAGDDACNDAPEVFDASGWKPKNYESASSRARCCCATRSRSRSTRSRSASRYDVDARDASRRSRTRWASSSELPTRDVARARLGRGHAARDDERDRDARGRRHRDGAAVHRGDRRQGDAAAAGRAGAAPRGRVRRDRHDAARSSRRAPATSRTR